MEPSDPLPPYDFVGDGRRTCLWVTAGLGSLVMGALVWDYQNSLQRRLLPEIRDTILLNTFNSLNVPDRDRSLIEFILTQKGGQCERVAKDFRVDPADVESLTAECEAVIAKLSMRFDKNGHIESYELDSGIK